MQCLGASSSHFNFIYAFRNCYQIQGLDLIRVPEDNRQRFMTFVEEALIKTIPKGKMQKTKMVV